MCQAAPTPPAVSDRPVLEQLVELGWEINNNHYRAVHLAARYDNSLQWFNEGLKSAALGIARELDIHSRTAREWIRVGQTLAYLPLIDHAFATNQISYAKARILTRYADEHNEQQLLDLAHDRNADQLTTAIIRVLDHDDPDDDAKDQRHYDYRSFTTYLDDDGMTVLRIVLPPAIAKPVIAAVDELVKQIAATPETPTNHPTPSDDTTTTSDRNGPAGPHRPPEHNTPQSKKRSLPLTLKELRQRWQPDDEDGGYLPTYDQQRADAFTVLFLGLPIALTTELVIHVTADGNTFNDGTPLTTNAITRQLDNTYIRLLLHDAQQNPIDATNKRRHPTTRQKRVVSAKHHQSVDCGTTILIEYDHNPTYQQTGHTITTELEPRCAPCHKARHRAANQTKAANQAAEQSSDSDPVFHPRRRPVHDETHGTDL